APAALFAILLFGLPGCGGGGDPTSASSTTASQGPAQGRVEQARQAQKSTAAPDEGTSNPPRQHGPIGDPEPRPKAVARGVPVTRGGDNSIQAFGTEGEEGSRSKAVADLTAYLHAFSAGDWSRVCALASDEYRRQLTELVAQAKTGEGAEKPKGCAAS